MNIQLTPQQQQVLDAQSVENVPRVIDPQTNAAYVLVPEAEYESVREIVEDDRRQRAIRAVALRNAAGRMDDLAAGPLGSLDAVALRDVIKAIGYVMESDCEPI